MLSVSTSSRSLASAPTARRGWRGRRGGSRLETVRRAQIGVDLVDAARNGLETFVQRASKALPILLGHDDTVEIERENESLDAAKTNSRTRAAELTQARVESLLKPDAGRDDIFHAAGQGLAGVGGDVVAIGWWDSRGVEGTSPQLELQALNDGARAQLIGVVLLALKEGLENIEESNGSLRELIQTVARVSANDWMNSMALDIGAKERCARVVRVAGDVADEKIWQNGEILEGSKMALYAGVMMYLAKNSNRTDNISESVQVVEKSTKINTQDVEPVLEFFNSPMASVCVSVLQDVVLNIADSVACAYVTCARESGLQAPVNGGVARTEDTGAVVRIPPFRDALSVRLKSTRSLEKFRNETSLRTWLARNYYDVVAMYEDWHKLWGMNANGELVTRKIHVCRQPELAKVKGFRLAVSMIIELADVSLPLFRSALNNCSRVASWLLVTLIGRSLGLVYRGIKESMDPQNRVKFT